MIINLNEISHYFLTVDTNSERKKHMIEEFKDYKLTEINPATGIDKKKSGATGFSRMIDIGLKNQDRNKPFQPFVMYEDDCSKCREFPESITVPDDADILYIGISICSMNNMSKKDIIKQFYNHINDDIVRIYNMLSTHGIIVCSASGALAIQKAVMEAYNKDIIWDIFVAYIQPYYAVYALKNPLVFQDSKYKGNEHATKISITGIKESPIPIEYINVTNDSIIMCHNHSMYK
jgi:hypothetical protein